MLTKGKKSGVQTIKGTDAFRKIEISAIDRIVRGQSTDKFVKTK